MIDPIEAVIKLVAQDADMQELVDDRVALRHRFGVADGGWTIPSSAITISPDGGPVDLYTRTSMLRFEVLCWGPTQYDCTLIYKQLVELTRTTKRAVVQTTDGPALVYYMVLVSAPTFVRDQDTAVDALMCFVQASVSELEAG